MILTRDRALQPDQNYTLGERPEQERWEDMQRFIKLSNIQKKGMGKENTASALKQWNNGDGEGPGIHIQMHEDTLVSGCDYAGSWGLSFTCTTYMCSARKNFIQWSYTHLHTCPSPRSTSYLHTLALNKDPHLQVNFACFPFRF